MKSLVILSMFVSLATACSKGSDSEVASLDAAKKANSENRIELWRAKFHGEDADEAAELVFKAGIPEGLKDFYSDDMWRFLNYKSGDVEKKEDDQLVFNKPSLAEV